MTSSQFLPISSWGYFISIYFGSYVASCSSRYEALFGTRSRASVLICPCIQRQWQACQLWPMSSLFLLDVYEVGPYYLSSCWVSRGENHLKQKFYLHFTSYYFDQKRSNIIVFYLSITKEFIFEIDTKGTYVTKGAWIAEEWKTLLQSQLS